MKKSEAAVLLGHAAAFDNRTVGKVDATAWASALHDVPLDDDATAAVARYYGTPPAREGERLWIQPHHVRSGRLAIRQERLGTTLPGYLPPAVPETGAEFVNRRRRQIEAVASGLAPARPVALTGPMSRQLYDGLVERGFGGLDSGRGLAAVGRAVATESDGEQQSLATVRRPGPLGVECPQCHAAIGRPCKSYRGHASKAVHGPRRRSAAGESAETLTAEEMERRREFYSARLQRQIDLQAESAEAAS
ncbi:hypothetical protein ACFQ9H_19375 [Streptomyces sp. NPDC056517]|uniref:zinc finger domain-containing protein n=1 Tax=Streptomyces sp. NPDC056517 TaxID=3345848 RepID=UPI00367BDCC0